MGSNASKMRHIPIVTEQLKNSDSFKKSSLKFHDTFHKKMNSFHDTLHYTAFPEEIQHKEQKKKEIEDSSKNNNGSK